MITPQEAERARHAIAVAKYSEDIEKHEKAIDAHLVENAGSVTADGSTEWTYGVRGIVLIVVEELVARYASCWDVTFDESGGQLVFRVKKPKRRRKPAQDVQSKSAAEGAGSDSDGSSAPGA
jgi:hypothetical protein